MENNSLKFPLVSIIVITYNSSKYVLETLESAKVQTYTNIELIVSDDCSKDDTVKVCREWLDKNQGSFVRTELISVTENTGIPKNCNRAVNASNGTWFKLIAGDDVLRENCVDYYISNIQNTKFSNAIYVSLMDYIDETGEKLYNHIPTDKHYMKFYNASLSNQVKTYARDAFFINSPTMFINKDILLKCGGFDEDFRIFEGKTLLFRLFEKGFRLILIQEKLVYYRISTISVSRSLDVERHRHLENLKCYKKYQRKYLCWYNPLDFSLIVYWFLYEKFGQRNLIFRVYNKFCLYRLYDKYFFE